MVNYQTVKIRTNDFKRRGKCREEGKKEKLNNNRTITVRDKRDDFNKKFLCYSPLRFTLFTPSPSPPPLRLANINDNDCKGSVRVQTEKLTVGHDRFFNPFPELFSFDDFENEISANGFAKNFFFFLLFSPLENSQHLSAFVF